MVRINEFSSMKELEVDKIITEVKRGNVILLKASTSDKVVEDIEKDYLRISEYEQIKKLRREMDKVNFIITHSIVNFVYSNLLQIKIDEIKWKSGEYSKPFIENEFLFQFNISHTNGCAIVVFSRYDIGVDIEYINYTFSFKDIIDISFSQSEREYIKGNHQRFYKVWVAKESYLKYIGIGLNKDLNTLNVIDKGKGHVEIFDSCIKKYKKINIFEPYSNFIGAICMDEKSEDGGYEQ